jgi:hypothetical protein
VETSNHIKNGASPKSHTSRKKKGITMKILDRSNKFLNISIAISIVLCSLSLFIYSISDVKAAPAKVESSISKDAFVPVGIFVRNNGVVLVIGYNSTTNDIQVLAEKKVIGY